MNIGFVVHDYDIREGHGRYAVELVTRLAIDHDVTVYAASIVTPPPPAVTVIPVPAVRRPSYASIVTFPRGFARVRRRHDVVHVQGWSADEADVVTAHIVLAAWRDAAARAGVRRGLGEQVLGPTVERRERDFYRRGSRYVIAPSRRVRADLARWYGRESEVSVIPHAFPAPTVDGRLPARRALGLPDEAFVALYAGDARKGLDVAIDALIDGDAVRLAVVTRTPIDRYRRRARAAGVEERVHWIGPLADLGPAYAAADVLLHPTIYDAFGLVVVEAMAAGVVPIVSAEAGATELFGPDAGLVVPRTASSCRAALVDLSRNRDRLARLSAGSRAAAAGRTWDDVARETTVLYERVAAS